MDLRRAGPEDGPVLARIFHDAVMFGAAGFYTPRQRRAWAGPGSDPAAWSDRVQMTDIWLDRSAHGFVGLNGAELDLLYVHSAHTGRGVGRALLDHVTDTAHRRGLAGLTAYASDVARPVLIARGWCVVRPNRVQRDGVWLQNTLMSLAFS